MHLEASVTSEDRDQFTAKIISKYQPLNNTSNIRKAARIDKHIQDFAQKLCEMYRKFYPVVHKTHYQHGMYLAFINSKRSNVDNLHQNYLNENHKIFSEHNKSHWLHMTSTTFEALLMNFRKLIVDTSEGEGKAISMTRIRDDIKTFHTNIKANSDEFTQFVENLNKQIEIANKPEIGGIWRYIYSYNIHLEDTYSVGTDDPFHILDLGILMDSVNNFINILRDFYGHKEPPYTAEIGYVKTLLWIRGFSIFKRHSMLELSRYIDTLAQLSTQPEYVDLTPKEASEKIFENEVLGNEKEFEVFKLIMENHVSDRITALKEELDLEKDL